MYVEHTHPGGGEGFIGIEVKYHESLVVSAADNRDRTNDLTENSGVFDPARLDELRKSPLQQVLLDHLLALSMLDADDWTSGLFVFLHPAANQRCYQVVEDYREAQTRMANRGSSSRSSANPWGTVLDHVFCDQAVTK